MANNGDWYSIDIEEVLKAKMGTKYKYVPGFVVSWLKRVLHQDDCNRFIADTKGIYGLPFADKALEKFECETNVYGLENIPDEGCFIFASNHPMGGLDGMAFMHAFAQKFGYDCKKVKFPVNDILLYVKNFKDIFLPVNKTGKTGREAAQLMEEAFASDSHILMFPAGLCSRKNDVGEIRDLEWKKTFVVKAVETKRDVIPVYITGRNSDFFYNLSRRRSKLGIKFNIEMLYLLDEMYKQAGKRIDVYFGKPISYSMFEGRNVKECAEEVREIVYKIGSEVTKI